MKIRIRMMMDVFKAFLSHLATGESLSEEQSAQAFEQLLAGHVSPVQQSAFLMALRVRGETVEELTGAVQTLRARMVRVQAPVDAIDIVGTGGDHSGSYNVSTLASLIVAACGVPVAKHGNRAASSQSGAADVLAELGVALGGTPEHISHCLEQAGVAFMFAPAHHASMKHVADVRKELGIRTIFNLIGPLSNPAGVKRQLLGVYDAAWLKPLVTVLQALGSERIWAVHGAGGLDEISTTGETHVVALENGVIRTFMITPEEVGLTRVSLDQIKGGTPAHNAQALRDVLKGAKIPYRDIGVLNAGAGLVIAQKAANLREGVRMAQAALDDGRVQTTLDALIIASRMEM
jgi:anthranilate phosphoribosyltransferase